MAYLYGRVVPADDRAAAQWFRKIVASHGAGESSVYLKVPAEFTSPLSDARTALSWIYASGRGLPQNKAAAVRALYGDEAIGSSFLLSNADAFDFWFLLFLAVMAACFCGLFRYAWMKRCRDPGLPLVLPLRAADRARQGTVIVDGASSKWTGVGANAKSRVMVMALIFFAFAVLFGIYLLWGGLPRLFAVLPQAFGQVPSMDLSEDWAVNRDIFMAWVSPMPPLLDALIDLFCAALMIGVAFFLPFMPCEVHWVPETGLSFGYWTRAPLQWAAWSDIAGWEMRRSGLLKCGRRLVIRTRDGRTLSLNGKTCGERLLPLLEAVRARTGAGPAAAA